jgi:hypothetical protein
MASSSRIEIEKFNGQNFELWKLKIEDLLVDREQWEVVCPGTIPTGMSREEWEKLERRERSMIQLCLADSVLLNVSGEDSTKKLWDKLGSLYQSKSLVNKLFLRNKLYLLRMSDGSSVTEHLNAFNTIISQLSSVDIKITEEEKCIILLCSFPDSWDSLVMAIGSNSTTLALEDMVASLLSEEMRRKNMEGSTKDALMVRGRPIDRDKGKFSGRKSKSKGRSKSLVQSMRRCWKCGKVGNYKRDCKSKEMEVSTRSDEKQSTERKTTPDKGGDVYLASTSTQSDQDVWLIDSGASYHMTPHREWFCEYERYEGGDVFLGDDSTTKIVGQGRVLTDTAGWEE